jgi:hypothetical protein
MPVRVASGKDTSRMAALAAGLKNATETIILNLDLGFLDGFRSRPDLSQTSIATKIVFLARMRNTSIIVQAQICNACHSYFESTLTLLLEGE